MFQALLSLPETIVEDSEALECLGWETIIVDECQQIRVLKHMEQIKMLTTDFRLLVASGQVKCCDHPYLVDQSLQTFLTRGLPEIEYLDVGVKASGKLQPLQSIGGSGRNSIGDIFPAP